MTFRKNRFLLLAMLLLIAMMAACGNKEEAGQGNTPNTPPATNQGEQPKEPETTPPPPPEPVTVTFFDPNANVPYERFMELYGTAIQNKYPHITTDFVSPPDTAAATLK